MTDTGIWGVDMLDETLGELDDMTLIVMRGHLSLERILHIKVAETLQSPHALSQARLSFAQLALLAKGMFYPSAGSERERHDADLFWDAVSALNSLRNRVAHQLDHGDIVPLLHRVFVITPYSGESFTDREFTGSLHHALAFLAFYASILSAERSG